jgi:LacI family transcriptional regulator
MAEKVTLNDIAEKVGLSPSTVSRVLNNSNLISDETTDRILRSAKEMGYEKRTIKKQKGRAILNIKLFLPVTQYSYVHLFYDVAELISGIYEGFQDTKVNIITKLNDGNEFSFQQKKLGEIDGCIFAFTLPDSEIYELVSARHIPTVMVNRVSPEHNFVAYDNYAGMARLVRELAARVPRCRPCYIGFQPVSAISDARREGIARVCAELKIPFIAEDVFELDSVEAVDQRFIKKIIKRKYNSVLCFNDFVAVYVYQAALHAGVSIPEDFSLTGFDNSPVRALLLKKIDTIDLSIHRLGYETGSWLRDAIIERNRKPLELFIEGAYVAGDTITAKREGDK